MKVGLSFLLTFTLLIANAADPPLLTFSFTNTNLEKVFKEIEKQTEFRFIYSKETIDHSSPVTIEAKKEDVTSVLKRCFEKQPLTYTIEEKYIIVKANLVSSIQQKVVPDIRGKVINENNEPVPGLTVTIKGSTTIAITEEDGTFTLNDVQPDAILIVSGAEIESTELKVGARTFIPAKVKTKTSELDKVVMMAYGSTSRRLGTGNIGKITTDQIQSQPISDPIASLEGRVAGLVVTQTNGVAGSMFKIQIRGQNSIGTSPGSLPFNNPLFVIDGVPYLPGGNFLNQLSSAAGNAVTGGLSAFNTINPNDIESIEILKDADATAIYGSLAANGVVLITTKKGKSGKTKFSLEVNTSLSRITKEMKFLNTSQYLQMRREAYHNDGIDPTIYDAPDLLVWDTMKHTDWTKELIGGTAHAVNLQSSVSGGNEKTQFLIAGAYHRETSVYPTDAADSKATFHANLNHNTKRFSVSLTTNYGYDNNKLFLNDLSIFQNLPPNFPSLYDSAGNLKWAEGGIPYRNFGIANPYSAILKKYSAHTDNLLTNVSVKYQIAERLQVRLNAGYNLTSIDEVFIDPVISKDPTRTRISQAQYGVSKVRSWIIEPQLEYGLQFKKLGALNVMVGGTWQGSDNSSTFLNGSGYPNDQFLYSSSAASTLYASNSIESYKYAAAFARINYNLDQTYIINLSGRRDGSSRFGPNNQFADFGAVGIGWIISNYDFIKNKMPVLSFFKVRASYGTTGNDQIGNYQFRETWTNTSFPYNGSTALYPTRLANPDFSWEVNRKLEVNGDIGFIKNKLLISVTHYRNRNGNQLINYSLPVQTGFTSILQNYPALVENKGWEFLLNAELVNSKQLKWSSSFNLTIPKNKLIAFPGLNESPYFNSLVIGQPLSIFRGFRYKSVDPASGLYQFQDVDKDGSINYPNDFQPLLTLDPKFYGGWENNFRMGNMQLSIMFEYRKQRGPGYLGVTPYNLPGFMYNQSVDVLNRWQKPGDISPTQKFTQTYADAFFSQINFIQSNHVFEDASYVRLKTLAFSYNIGELISKNTGVQECTLYLRAQNLITITKYTAGDPETRNPYSLPPLKTISIGIKVSL